MAPRSCWPLPRPPGWSPSWSTSSPRDGFPRLALTGGGVGTRVLAHLNASPARDAVDWGRVEIFWGDERFVPVDGPGPERDCRPGRPARPCPGRPGQGAHDGRVRRRVRRRRRCRRCCLRRTSSMRVLDSIWSCSAWATRDMWPRSSPSPPRSTTPARWCAVRNCPKPPPTRISLTLPTIRRANEVWIITAAASKAGAVAMALGGAGEVAVPAAGATGRSQDPVVAGSAVRLGAAGRHFAVPGVLIAQPGGIRRTRASTATGRTATGFRMDPKHGAETRATPPR